ncbi:MAG TPA: CHAT domain-containing protein, partial [Dehalococcoidia bacterium]
PGKPCRDLLGGRPGKNDPLPFSFAAAHSLYEALFAPIRDEIRNRHLLVVSSGALSSLPLHVLVTEKPAVAQGRTWADYRHIAWLARSNPITVLPSAASIKALMRGAAKNDARAIPYMGFGNPLLDGNPADPDEVAAARRARGLKTCADVAALSADAEAGRRALRLLPQDALPPEREVASIEVLRAQPPLWETAKEICDVAQAVNASTEHIYLGSRATEQVLRDLSERGVLRNARIVHFATHGVLATDSEDAKLQVHGEAGLLLTPPRAGASYEELRKGDGLLTASEIAQLKLDADWVVLSACNSAGGERTGGEALSGLARAFFFAGARGLLASHWYVDSDATTDLITGLFQELKKDGHLRRAEALQRSMRQMFEGASATRAHPTLWAPFVVVGGAAG